MSRIDIFYVAAMPDDLKDELRNLPLDKATITEFDDTYSAVIFNVTTIPDYELGNSPMYISKWLINTFGCKHGQQVYLHGFEI